MSIVPLLIRRELQAVLGADGFRDIAATLKGLPGHIVALGANEGEHVILPPIFTDQCGGQPHAAAGLNLGGRAEDRAGSKCTSS